MITIQAVELGVLGPLQVRLDGAPVTIPGAKPRAVLTMLGLHGDSVVSAEMLVDLLWGDDPPRTAIKALQTHISSLRRALGDGFVLTEGLGWILNTTEVDGARYKLATKAGRDAAAIGDSNQAVACFDEALSLWRGTPELPDTRRGISEKTRWVEGHAALVEDRADALLATGRAAEMIGDLEAAVADAPLRERRWGQLMLALYRAGRQGEALGAYQRARSLLAGELGVDPGPELRRLESAIVAQDAELDYPVTQHLPSVTRAVTFLLTDIEGSTAAWEADAGAMAVALARHDELAEQIVTSRGGRLIKTRGEGDATFSVFERPSAAAAAALELQDAILREPWPLREPLRIRVALHTGEVELRDGDYFGRAVNRAARLRSLAVGGQILCSGATAELVIDALPDDVVLADLGMRQLRNLPRPEHVFELRPRTAEQQVGAVDEPFERPALPSALTRPGPFVGRGRELERLAAAWQSTLAGGMHAVLIAGEPGVGKTRLAAEWSRQTYEQSAVVLYGRSDEDLGAPYQPFAEALRALVPHVSPGRLRGLRGVEALLPLVPGLIEVLPDLCPPPRADPDTERYALFDAVVALLELASASAPIVLVLDDLHWAAKPTLLLLRHLLRFGENTRVQVVATYRSTDLDRSHPLAAMLADLNRDGTACRLALDGLDENDVTTYVTDAGYDDELAHALASVTGGNPFFLIEVLRHVDESGGVWDPSTLPQGVREAVSRRLSRLPAETNKALAAAAVVGSHFTLNLVERVVDRDLVDAFDEAGTAGIVIEEPGGRYRFNHAIVRHSLLAELASVRRMRLHQRIAATLEGEPGADDELLADLAYHYFECAWAGNAAKAVEYCRRAADQAMTRLAYEGAADLYDRALHALDEVDEELPDRGDQAAELLIARCEALLAAGDMASAAGAVAQLQSTTVDSARLTAWATCFDGQLSMLTHPERLDEVESAVAAAADKLARIADAAGEAKAHTVRAGCLARLGRIGDCEVALDNALNAARRAHEHRRVNAVLAGAPLAALWGPNPVPRAGGRCLDVVRLLRITTDSPAVEATSTRCQAVLEAFRGRAATARRMIDSARRTVTDLGLRHALLEVEQFAGIVELLADEPGAAEPHLRQAYDGFRRMGVDADTAETAALLGRACLALDRNAEAEELCSESERLAGHGLKASIAWRTLRALLFACHGDHGEARRIAEAAVGLAEQTDALVDHGDACLTLATVLAAADDAPGSRAAAERAVGLYERKGAAALAEKALHVVGEHVPPTATVRSDAPAIKPDNMAVRVGERVMAALHRKAWDEVEQLFAPDLVVDSRRKIVGLPLPSEEVRRGMRREINSGTAQVDHVMIAARGQRLALSRLITTLPDTGPGAPQDELLQLYGIDDEGRVALQVWFDVEDMDAAIAELDSLHARFETERPPSRQLENAASRVLEQYFARYADRDWDVMAATLADDFVTDDRRRVTNAGVRHGRDAEIANMQSFAEIGILSIAPVAIATRGERLALVRHDVSFRDWAEPSSAVIGVVEINTDNQIRAHVMFDAADIDDALTELDARYLAGEAAAHAQTWSLVTHAFGALNRRVLFPTTPDWVNIDHRRATPIGPGEMPELLSAAWMFRSDLRYYIASVHRLNALGAVYTYAAHEITRDGSRAERRPISVITFDGELVNRCEVFDEEDLDAAITRFEELHHQRRRLENTASRLYERFTVCFAAHDWRAVAAMMADNVSTEDHRRVVNAGLRQGPAAVLAEVKGLAEVIKTITAEVIATRGARLALTQTRTEGYEAFITDLLDVVEVDADGKAVSKVVFEMNDFAGAVAELDARYLAGEAAACARTWSVITQTYAAANRNQLELAPDCVTIDHRRARAFRPGELTEYMHATWELAPDARVYVESIHRLSVLGAVVTHVAQGISHEGFDAEWREVSLVMADGDRITRCELFDETDLDTALARFEELHPQPRRLENAASRVQARFEMSFASRDWDAMAELLADNIATDDRRPLVGVGVRHGRDTVIADWQTTADVGVRYVTSTVIATRGEHLVLNRYRFCGHDQRPAAFRTDVLGVLEIDSGQRATSGVMFDLEALDAAFAELDARYLAGEAAPYANTWTVITDACAAFNRYEVPAVNWINVDHRRGMPFASGDLAAALRAFWDLTPEFRIQIEQVHRLGDFGVVITHHSQGISPEGVEVEWRMIQVLTVEDGRLARCELFDEDDLDAAIARFEELQVPMHRLENGASRLYERFKARFAFRDWQAVSQMLTDYVSTEDRRRVINNGIARGRAAVMGQISSLAEVGLRPLSDVVATRGKRLVLSRVRTSDSAATTDVFYSIGLDVLEVDADERLVAQVVFDADDFDAAFAELDARYLAGEAAPYARTWSAITTGYAALNRHEIPSVAPGLVSIDHRRGVAFEPGRMIPYMDATFSVAPDIQIRLEVVHRLSTLGVVLTHAAHGTSQEGFNAEWRETVLLTVDGDVVNRCEMFDEDDLAAALARFEELDRRPGQLENAASQAYERFRAYFAARDWAAMAELLTADTSVHDHRRVINAEIRRGRDVEITNMQAFADIGATRSTAAVIAARGDHLVLCRTCISGEENRAGGFRIELLIIVETTADKRILARVAYDPDDIDAAFEELDARYLAGEAAAFAHTWSVITRAYTVLNGRGLPATTPSWVNIDHRRGAAFARGEMSAYIAAAWDDLEQDLNIYVENVHRMSELGAVLTQVLTGTTREGFDAEWRTINLYTVDDDFISRCELFDESDLDAALARFDELSRSMPHH